TNQNETLQARVDELTKELEKLQGGDTNDLTSVKENYDALLDAYNSFQSGDKAAAAEKLSKIKKDQLSSDVAQEFYKKVKDETYSEASKTYFEEGRDAYNGEGEYAGHKDYEKAIELLEQALTYDKTNTDAIYFLGRCYQQQSEAEKAKEYYNQIIEDYPDSSRLNEAKRRMRELGE
ncbi:MAG: tetratricopeptide repeat protein, partial [Lachnospiraceae bacterium]|nr:tetratricopeptide repeat protein [Lachnospiraceae bacterium]